VQKLECKVFFVFEYYFKDNLSVEKMYRSTKVRICLFFWQFHLFIKNQ